MSDLMRTTTNSLAKQDSLTNSAGNALVTVGAGGLAIGSIAYLLPFITLPMILIAAVVFGAYLKMK